MSRPVAVLRPEPGNAATAAALRAAGAAVRCLPLFRVAPVDWAVPDPAAYDGLLVTSANAMRLGGPGLTMLRRLPVHAVGAATARAAEAAGFAVARVGDADAAALVAAAPGRRLLHLAGRDRIAQPGAAAITVYAADPLPVDTAALHATVAMLHSARAARRLATLLPPAARATIRLAAISPAVAAAAGDGWQRVTSIPRPADARLVALAIALAD